MRRVILVVFSLLALTVSGQDLHFAQSSQTPLLINPAAAGVFDGWERININHRNQWLGASTQFMTTSIAADVNIGKSRMNDKAYLGLGLMFYNDIGGDANFGNQTGSFTLSGVLPMGGSGHTLSAGVQGGFGQRSANFSNLRFMNQWDGSEFNPDILSGEPNSGRSFTYLDANAGIFYMYDAGKNSFARNNDFKFQIGFSGYHLNRPTLKFSSGAESEQLHMKFVGHTSIVADIANTNFAVDGSIAQFKQGGHYETLLGLMFRYRFENGTKITGFTHDAYFGFGMYGRIKDAIIPAIAVDWRGFHFGVSYDVTLSDLRKAYGGGSLEFSLGYINFHDAIFKTKGRRM